MKLNKEKRLLLYLSIIVIVVGLAIYFSVNNERGDINLPDDFINSYEDVLNGSQEVIELTNETNDKIKEINELDNLNQKSAALLLISEAREVNSRARAQAFDLSSDLEEMAKSVSLVSPSSAQTSALELVSIGSAIIQEFINYVVALEDFLGNLSIAINTNSPSDRALVDSKVENLNDKNYEINQLNQLFISKSNNLGLLNNLVGVQVDVR